jgi:hypothetical protein
VKFLISNFIELKMYMLKICLWQFRSLKHSSENSYWQPGTQAGQSNMDTKLCNFFCQSVNDISSLILTSMNLVQYGSCNIRTKRSKKTCNFCVSLTSAMHTSIQTNRRHRTKVLFNWKILKPLHDIFYSSKITNKYRHEYFNSDQYFHSPLSFQQNTVLVLQKPQPLFGTQLWLWKLGK